MANPRFVVWSLWLIGASLLLYTGIRAATLSFTFDEVYSLGMAHSGFQLYYGSDEHMGANNHWLNSFFLWIISQVSAHNFFLRLPQLLAHALFLFCSGKLILHLRRDGFAVAAFILINVNPYLLDFFSLARGYGLSLGCMMAALYFYWKFTQRPLSLRTVLPVILFSVLTVFSSFAMLNFFLVLMLMLVVHIQLSDATRKLKLQLHTTVLACTALLAVIVIPHLLKLQSTGALYFGHPEFWNGSVKSVIERLLYGRAGTDFWIVAQFVISMSCLHLPVPTFSQFRLLPRLEAGR